MKTGEVKDPGDGTDQYLDCDGWTPWLYYDPSDEELERYYTDTNALMMRLERMPPAVHRRQKRIDLRCPAKGCRLAAVYWLPRRPTAWEIEDNRRRLAMRDANGRPVYSKPYQPGHYLYVGRTPAVPRCTTSSTTSSGLRRRMSALAANATVAFTGVRGVVTAPLPSSARASMTCSLLQIGCSRPCRPKNRLLRTSLITCGRSGASASSIPNLRRGIQGNEPPRR